MLASVCLWIDCWDHISGFMSVNWVLESFCRHYMLASDFCVWVECWNHFSGLVSVNWVLESFCRHCMLASDCLWIDCWNHISGFMSVNWVLESFCRHSMLASVCELSAGIISQACCGLVLVQCVLLVCELCGQSAWCYLNDCNKLPQAMVYLGREQRVLLKSADMT